jgi:putative membrane protein
MRIDSGQVLKHWPLSLLWAVYLVFLIGGIGSHVLTGGTPANMLWAAPFFLALASGIAIASEPSLWKPMCAAAAIGFIAELTGVRTGFPFGHYEYTGVLHPLVGGVPVVVAGAWMVLFAYVSQMRVNPVLAALWMAAIDLIIDPLAANDLGYWRWLQDGPYYGIPTINFAGWFAVGLIIFYSLSRFPAPRNASIAMLGRTIIFFFAAISAAHHYLFPAFFGVALAAFGYWRFRSTQTLIPLSHRT